MATYEKWNFTIEQLNNSPSRKSGIDSATEIRYKQEATNYIQVFGEKCLLSQNCINTAMVYMHRFYMYHSFKHFHRHAMAAATLFLAAKIEDETKPMEIIIRIAFTDLLHKIPETSIANSDMYIKLARDLLLNEEILLKTLGFELTVNHPQIHIKKCCMMIRASPDILKWSNIIAINSLHLTSMCLQYSPSAIACFCIYFVCKWSNMEIPMSIEGKQWFQYINESVTEDLLQKMVTEFLEVYEKCHQSCLKRRIVSVTSRTSPETSDSGYLSPKYEQDYLLSPKKRMALSRIYRLNKMKIYARQ